MWNDDEQTDSGVDETASDYTIEEDELDTSWTTSRGALPVRSLLISLFSLTVVVFALALGPPLKRLAFGNGFGEDCHGPEGCRSGLCMVTSSGYGLLANKGGFCSSDCDIDSDCPDGYRCGDDACVQKPTAEIGEPCKNKWDCREGECLVRQKRGSDPFGSPVYEEMGTCAPEGALEEQNKRAKEIREALQQLKNLQNSNRP